MFWAAFTINTFGYSFRNGQARSGATVVAGQNTNVVIQIRHQLDDSRQGPFVRVYVQVAEMKDFEALECRGQPRTDDGIASELYVLRIFSTSPVQAQQLQRGGDE